MREKNKSLFSSFLYSTWSTRSLFVLLLLLFVPKSLSQDGCPAVWPSTISCGGHGICVNFTCICDEGWSGATDLALFNGADCVTHVPTRIGIVSLLLISNIVESIGIIYILIIIILHDLCLAHNASPIPSTKVPHLSLCGPISSPLLYP